MKLFGCTFAAILALFAGALRDAYASPELRRGAILTTVAEAAVAAAALIQEHTAGSDEQSFKWSVRYSERDWTLDFRGPEVNFLTMNESLLIAILAWAKSKENHLVSMAEHIGHTMKKRRTT